MSHIEAMKQAIEALEEPKEHIAKHRRLEAISSLRQAIAEAEKQEPVAWAMLHDNGDFIDAIHPEEHAREEGEYTHPVYIGPQPKVEQDPDDLTIAYLSGVYDGKKNYKNSLVKQARYVRNYSNTEESFEAVPLSFILEDYEHGMEAAHNIKEKT